MTRLRKPCRHFPIAGGLGLVMLVWLAWQPVGCGPKVGPPREAQVIRVLDGDQVVLVGGTLVRLIGIDAPERERPGRAAQPLAQRAKDYVSGLVLEKTVRLQYDRERYDRAGRLLAYLYLPGGTLVNAAVVRQGLARVHLHSPNMRHEEDLLAAQQEALAARQGLWQRSPSPVTKK